MFEIKKKDGLGRIGRLTINGKSIETPTLGIVINPHKMIVDVEFIKKYFYDAFIITNAYILMNSKYKEEILEKGIHDFLGYEGVVYTDSGTFQMYSKGNVPISNAQTINFQLEIGSDIITPLDVFTFPDDSYGIAKKKMYETLKRIEYLRGVVGNKGYVFPIQGGRFLSLRERVAWISNAYDASIFAVGGIVPLMEQYRYKELMRIIFSVKSKIKSQSPIHAFGAGHPMLFGLLVMAGVDIFDSASYALYAEDGRYLTENKTLNIKEMDYLPCNCPVCSNKTPKEMTKEDIAKHNLFVIFKEIRNIKEHIKKGNLYEYVEQRIGSHPELINAYRLLRSERIQTILVENESVTKQTSGWWVRSETSYRPIFKIVDRKLRFVNSRFRKFKWIGNRLVPISLSLTYPFGQFQYVKEFEKHKEMIKEIFKKGDKEEIIKVVKDIMAWQFESDKVYGLDLLEGFEYEVSHTGRLKYIKEGNKVMATLRPGDNVFVLSKDFAKELFEKGVLHKKVVVEDVAKEFVSKGKNVFCKFVLDVEGGINPNDVVAVVDNKDVFLNYGFAVLSGKEMKEFARGVGVNVKG